jgi:propanediol dehydratase small subunit
MSSFAKSAFDDSSRSLHKKDYLLADNVVARAERMGTMENVTMKAIVGKVRVTEMANLRMIMESTRRTAEYASDIGEVVLNLNVAPA